MNTFLQLLKKEKLPLPEVEYRFCGRRWRFDYAYPDRKIAIEQEGAVWVSGRHTRGSGFVKDMEKYNQAAILGWRLLRYTPEQILGQAVDDLKIILK
ncbi:MAG: hypothetical protein KKH44_08765 [Bacteroidetes bacterium]|nr:hypothetical protein [Bacteroidota bacterium]